MTNKLLIILAVFATLTLVNSKADAQTTTGAIPVKITIGDVLAVTLIDNTEIAFTYNLPADYQNAKTVTRTGQLSVISTKPYSVKVTATSLFTTFAGNASPLPLSVLTVAATGTTPANNATLAGPVALNDAINTPVTIASAGLPSLATLYNISYSIPNAAPLIGKVAGDYLTNLVYSVTQP